MHGVHPITRAMSIVVHTFLCSWCARFNSLVDHPVAFCAWHLLCHPAPLQLSTPFTCSYAAPAPALRTLKEKNKQGKAKCVGAICIT